jgi:hypothetical protein
MVCRPIVIVLMLKVAWPLTSVAVPKRLPLRKIDTLPVGVPLPGAVALTVTVKTTFWLSCDGLGLPAMVTVLLALTMLKSSGVGVLDGLKWLSAGVPIEASWPL